MQVAMIPGPKPGWEQDAMATRSGNSSRSIFSHADGLAASTADIWLLIGRILLGWIFVRSGYGKLFNIEAVANSFPLRGLPPFLAYIAVPFEFFGGIALILASPRVTSFLVSLSSCWSRPSARTGIGNLRTRPRAAPRTPASIRTWPCSVASSSCLFAVPDGLALTAGYARANKGIWQSLTHRLAPSLIVLPTNSKKKRPTSRSACSDK